MATCTLLIYELASSSSLFSNGLTLNNTKKYSSFTGLPAGNVGDEKKREKGGRENAMYICVWKEGVTSRRILFNSPCNTLKIILRSVSKITKYLKCFLVQTEGAQFYIQVLVGP